MKSNPNFSEISKRDYKLVCDALKGNQRAFSQIMTIYRPLINFEIFKMVNNKVIAEDLTLEVFEKAFLKLHQYKSEFAFCTWLFRIATNCGLDYLRKRKRHRHLSIDNPTEVPEHFVNGFQMPGPITPEQELIEKQKRKVMRIMVDKLKPQYRQLVEMHYFKQYSFNEITQELEIPLGTVKNRMFRSRELLYDRLKTYRKFI